jgi:hypothetical protein
VRTSRPTREDLAHGRQDHAGSQLFGEQPRGQDPDDQRLDGARGGGDASREAVGRDEQQRLEHPDVERAEDGGAPEPGAPWQASRSEGQQQTDGQHPHRGGQQRPVRLWRGVQPSEPTHER